MAAPRQCRKCETMKTTDDFASYTRKDDGRTYMRHICKRCFNDRKIEYRMEKNSRTCIVCGDTKHKSLFPNWKSLGPNSKLKVTCNKCIAYKSKRTRTYRAVNNKRELNGEVVLNLPNTYISEQQRIDGFNLMEALGFTFNQDTGIWFKEGVKNPDGTFVKVEDRRRQEMERMAKEVEEYDVFTQIRYLRERGWMLKDISKKYNISFSTVYKFLKNGQKTKN